ncbi:hypothetical protein [Salisediminibacterium halotolerans]|uniref:hypothetical protein n=1 Tax=Salisediminibacterium halotolerans TaxID=517425 RepID=UPI000EAF5B30|nr:hypothetical protein [Salisediminibacterium halotolerans]RLJ78235.1 hypothetical protein BCL39_0706 [Actinophytocola xinjiangensis]RPE88426.1 hypothetical protein EDD67_0753 [Salisediminibacterium halotolerans]TWG37212.1 hypothetical protein BCL52_0705 [Salisediminibacterium halotolerans]GEL07146.1 hypothetical protein SHA02_05620 [Salisediminibacterium halotolerans]
MTHAVFFLAGLIIAALALSFAPSVCSRKMTALSTAAGACSAAVMVVLTELYNAWFAAGASFLFAAAAALWLTERFRESSRSKEGETALYSGKTADDQEFSLTASDKAYPAGKEADMNKGINEQNDESDLELSEWFEPKRRTLLSAEDENREYDENKDLPLRGYTVDETLHTQRENIAASADNLSGQNQEKSYSDHKRRELWARLEEDAAQEND